jgi:hypothetical protein
MKKATNRFRKCPNCPHNKQQEPRCCCHRNTTSRRPRHKREPSTIDQSNLNTTIPTIPTIIAEFSALRTENNQLKR